VEEAVKRNHQTEETMAVIFIDLDDFKSVNDTFGHEAGDELLKEVARRLRLCLRGEDIAARLGGDEFAVLVEHSSDAERVAQRILEVLETPVRVANRDLVVTASLGIAVAGPEIDSSGTVLANADTAMYVAKGKGKGRYALFASEMQNDAEIRMRLRGDMQQALDNGQFIVHYQPIIELESRECTGAEALVRWSHPEFGLVPPVSFIAIAEESGFIHELGRFVLGQATSKAAVWQRTHDGQALSVSVNISAHQLQQGDLAADVREALIHSGLDPELLILEITETVLMRDPEFAIRALMDLKSLGVRIAIDDFGTGYSSLSYLKRLPVDILKIDKSFIDDLEDGPEESALARAVINLGRTLNLKIVAEGIETPGQLELLDSFGCQYVQGYLLSRPLDAQAIEHSLAIEDMAPVPPAP